MGYGSRVMGQWVMGQWVMGHGSMGHGSWDLLASIQFQETTHFPICTRCWENQNNTYAKNRKISGLKLILCSGAIWWHRQKFEHGCTTPNQPYKKPPKHFFLELHGLIDFRCAQTLALPCAFGTNLKVFSGTL